MPKLSIITINLNNAKGLQKTIESVFCQKFNDYEYVIIDGGSSDRSLDIIHNFKDGLNYYISEPDNGIYNAQNKGIKVAKGEYCLFLNSGDYLIDENVLTFLWQDNINEDLLYGNGLFTIDGRDISYNYPDENEITFRFLMGTSLCHPSIFFKRSLFDKFGQYDEKYSVAADWDYYVRLIFKYNVSLKKIDRIISKFDLSGLSSQPDTKERMMIEREEILNNNFRYFLKDYKELERLDHSKPMALYRFLKRMVSSLKVC